MKQKLSYDCGQTCLRALGFDPPDIRRGLTGDDIKKCLGRAFTREFICIGGANSNLIELSDLYEVGFATPGIYLFMNPKNGGAHWVACSYDGVIDPKDGVTYHRDIILSNYNKDGWKLVMGLEVSLDQYICDG